MRNRRSFIKLGGLAAIGANHSALAKSPNKKTFIHGFNFKFKKGVPDEKIAGMMKELAALKEKIPVLKELLIGKNVAQWNRGFQYGEIAVFEKKEDLEIFDKHPEHRKLVKKIIPKIAGGNAMDFIPIDA